MQKLGNRPWDPTNRKFVGNNPRSFTAFKGPIFDIVLKITCPLPGEGQQALTLNQQEPGKWDEVPVHKDGKNVTDSYAAAWGKYEGGELHYVNEDGSIQKVDNHGKFVRFQGGRTHAVSKVTRGTRYGLIFYRLPRSAIGSTPIPARWWW